MSLKGFLMIAGIVLCCGASIYSASEGYWTDEELLLSSSTATLLKVTSGKLYLSKSKTASGTSFTFVSQTVGVNGIVATISAAASASDDYLVTGLATKEYTDFRASQLWPDAEATGFDIDDYVDSDDMIGTIMPVAADNAAAVIATGRWLECNGAQVTTANYPTLNVRIGYTFGGTSSGFNLPNLAAKTIIGAGAGSGLTSRTVAATGGAARITLATGHLPQHTHGVTDPGHDHGATTFTRNNGNEDDEHRNLDSPGTSELVTNVIANAATNISLGSTGSNQSYLHMQPYTVVRYYIRVK